MRLRPPLTLTALVLTACAQLALAALSTDPTTLTRTSQQARNTQPTNNNKKPDPCKNLWRYPYNCLNNCTYMLIWRHKPEDDSIEFVVTTKYARRWTGVGFAPNRNLTNADGVFAWIEDDTRFVMMDANLKNYSRARSDKQQSIFNLNAKGSYDGIFVFKFSRLRNTGDEEDFLLSDSSCPYVIFPVEGGSVEHKNRTVVTTENEPLVSEERVCFTACDANRKFNFTNTKASRVPREQPQPTTISPTTTTSTPRPLPPSTTTTTTTTTTPRPPPPTTTTTTSTTTTTTTTTTSTTTTTTTPAPQPASSTSGERLVHAASEPALATDQQQWCTGRWLFPAGCRFQHPETVSYLQLPVDRTRVIQPLPLELSDCSYAAQWQYEETTDLIKFIVQTKTRSRWTGVGFSNSTRMLNSDAIIGLIDELSGRHFIMDTWLRDHVMPDIDVEQNAVDTSGKRENGTTTIRFSRPRRTKDQFDFQFSDEACAYFFFPTQGGSFNAISKRLYKHEQTPSVSREKICIRACTIGDISEQTLATSQAPELTSSSSSSSIAALPPVTILPSTSSSPSTKPPPQASTDGSLQDLQVELDSASTSSNSSSSPSGAGQATTPFMRLGFLSEPSLRWLAGIGCVATLLAMIVFQACFTVYKNKQAYKQALFRQSAFKQNATYLHATQAASSVTTTSYPSTQTALRCEEDEPKKRIVSDTIVVGDEDELEDELDEEELVDDEMELEDDAEYVGEDGFGDEEEYDEDDELAMERSLNYARWRARYAHPHQHPMHSDGQHHHHHQQIHSLHQHSRPHHQQTRQHQHHQQPAYPHVRPHHQQHHSQSQHRHHQHSHHPHQHYHSPHPLQAHLPHSRSQSQAARPDAYFLPSQRRY